LACVSFVGAKAYAFMTATLWTIMFSTFW